MQGTRPDREAGGGARVGVRRAPSYLLDQGKDPSLLDEELLEGLRDETTRQITREAMRLPERERGIVLGIVRQFGGGSPPSG